jgi:competence protein ComEC
VLFTGDAGGKAVADLVTTGADLRSDVLKVPHHGSRFSAAEELAAAARPAIAVVSVAAGNPYRHPAPVTVEAYETAGAQFLRTDRDGAVSITLAPEGARSAAWADLLLRRTDAKAPNNRLKPEQENWERLGKRAAW